MFRIGIAYRVCIPLLPWHVFTEQPHGSGLCIGETNGQFETVEKHNNDYDVSDSSKK